MHIVLAALFSFAVLTLWIPAEWPVAVFQVGIVALAGYVVCRSDWPVSFAWPAVPLAFAVVWGLLQCLTGWASYAFVAKSAIVQWVTLLAVFLIGLRAWREEPRLRWFQAFMI